MESPWDQIQVAWLDSKHLCPLRHLAGPYYTHTLINQNFLSHPYKMNTDYPPPTPAPSVYPSHFLTNLSHILIRFVLQSAKFPEDCLCDQGRFEQVYQSLLGLAVGAQLKTKALPFPEPIRGQQFNSKEGGPEALLHPCLTVDAVVGASLAQVTTAAASHAHNGYWLSQLAWDGPL